MWRNVHSPAASKILGATTGEVLYCRKNNDTKGQCITSVALIRLSAGAAIKLHSNVKSVGGGPFTHWLYSSELRPRLVCSNENPLPTAIESQA